MRLLTMCVSALAACSVGMTALADGTSFVINEDDYTIDAPLTDQAGDPAKGLQAFVGRKKGNCLACHAVEQLKDDYQFHGEVGPELTVIGEDYSTAELRLRVVGSKFLNEDSIMPSFLQKTGYTRPDPKFDGKSILTPQEVEDIVAYLATLK